MTQEQDYEADQIFNVSNFERIPPSPVKDQSDWRERGCGKWGLLQIRPQLSCDSNTNKQTNKQTF